MYNLLPETSSYQPIIFANVFSSIDVLNIYNVKEYSIQTIKVDRRENQIKSITRNKDGQVNALKSNSKYILTRFRQSHRPRFDNCATKPKSILQLSSKTINI